MADRNLTPADLAAARVFALALEKCGRTQEEVAAEVGVTPGMIHQWAKPLRPVSARRARALAHAVGIDDPSTISAAYAETMGGSASPRREPAHGPNLVWVNKINGARLSAGSGEVIYDVEEQQNSHGFRADYMQRRGLKAQRCKLWTVKGDSMEPRYSSGDVVLIDMSDREPRHGKVFAIVGDNELRIKQLIKDVAGWSMRSLNPDKVRYPDEPITSDGVAIIGRVRWRGGDED